MDAYTIWVYRRLGLVRCSAWLSVGWERASSARWIWPRGYMEEPLVLEQTGDFQQDVRAGTLAFLARFERRLRAEPGQWAVLERIWDSELEVES